MVMINDQQGFRNIAELMTNPQCPACGEKLDFKQEDAATGQLLPTFKAQHHDKDFYVDLNMMPVIVSVSPTPQPRPAATAAAATTVEDKKKESVNETESEPQETEPRPKRRQQQQQQL